MTGTFVKRNRSPYADWLVREAQGLEALRTAASRTGIGVPCVLGVDETALRLTRIDGASATREGWEILGRGLAAIHATSADAFGLGHDNYIGLNPQQNTRCPSWGDFFIGARLRFQLARVRDVKRRRRFEQRLSARAPRLKAFLDERCAHPGLVHGDLWSGNVLFDSQGRVWLIDPAVHFADPEVDLAMTAMFGGFPPAFHEAYRALRPRPPAQAQAARIYNLYHYLNHLNLFGDGYLDGCEDGFAAIDAI